MKGKTWLQKYLMEKSKPEQTKPLQNHQQKYGRIHSQSTIIIRESIKTQQKSTPIEADEEYTINIPQNNSLQLGGQEIGQLSFLSSNQPRNPLSHQSSQAKTLPPLFLLPFSSLLGITFLSKSPTASSCSCISQYGLPNYPHCCCTLHADNIKLSVGGPLPFLKNVIPNPEKSAPLLLTKSSSLTTKKLLRVSSNKCLHPIAFPNHYLVH